ncbi:MAG: PDZ domain-containing protein [Gemmatimonadota bacterium]
MVRHPTPAALSMVLALALLPGLLTAQGAAPRLFTDPDVSADQICFSYAGDIWLVPRSGGDAHRLTATPGNEGRCRFSPDGRLVGYTSGRENNADVYVVGVDGGTPTRLTWHPATDMVSDWTPDGRLLFASLRDGVTPGGIPFQFYTQGVQEVAATPLRLQGALDASYSSDGSRLAYTEFMAANDIWKRYRGGRTPGIWLATLSNAAIEKVPHAGSSDGYPMWVGDTVFFLSDRDGPTTLYGYNLSTKSVGRRIDNTSLDIKSAQAGPGAIIYDQFGSIQLYDIASGRTSPVDIRIDGELTATLPNWAGVGSQLGSAALSPTGQRAAFEAHGEIITVPADKGDPRNITNTTGTMERSPAWSPDGQTVAYFTEAGGQYQLALQSQDGRGTPRRISLGGGDNFDYTPTWSPDAKSIAFTNSRGEIWLVDLASGKLTKVDANPFGSFGQAGTSLSWSKNSRWLAYSRAISNRLPAVFVFDRTDGRIHQMTDGMSSASNPAFDASGKYLYFLASTDAGPATDFSMTTFDHPVTSTLYAIVLARDSASPMAPESDEEPARPDTTTAKAKANAKPPTPVDSTAVTVDFDGIDQRAVALPVDPKNFVAIVAGKAGTVLLAEAPLVPVDLQDGGEGVTLHSFDLKERKTTELLGDVTSFDVSRDGGKLLYHKDNSWAIADLTKPIKPGDGALATAAIQVKTDPRAEWAQMYHEAFRFQRAFFYDPDFHGLDLDATERFYERYLPGLGSRADLDQLFREAFGNLTVGHLFVSGPPGGGDGTPANGVLGADYTASNGHWRFAKIYAGESWNPQLSAPLTQPGVNVMAGEYLLAVNGASLTTATNVNAALAGTAGKQVMLRVGPNADGTDARDVTVVPLASEGMLRHLAWIDHNRRVVDSLSGGKLAYLYIPNTANEGYTRFNRYFFAQQDKQGAVVDERYNQGGNIADYMVYYLIKNAPFNYATQRYGEDVPIPAGAIYGPKAMLINEWAGSGGDELPWLFRRFKAGPLIGTRTWGGLVGIGGYPSLMDGGSVTAPRVSLWSYEGKYEVENQGVAPDIEVTADPAAWRQGRDVQLEHAVKVVMDSLAQHPFVAPSRPPFPTWAKGRTPGEK